MHCGSEKGKGDFMAQGTMFISLHTFLFYVNNMHGFEKYISIYMPFTGYHHQWQNFNPQKQYSLRNHVWSL